MMHQMIWKLISYPILIVSMVVVTTLLEFACLPIILALRNHKRILIALLVTQDILGPIIAVFVAVTIAANSRLVLPLAIVIVTFLLHVRNGFSRLSLAEAGASQPALVAAAAGHAYDRIGEVRLEWLSLAALNGGFAVAVALWWSWFEGFF